MRWAASRPVTVGWDRVSPGLFRQTATRGAATGEPPKWQMRTTFQRCRPAGWREATVAVACGIHEPRVVLVPTRVRRVCLCLGSFSSEHCLLSFTLLKFLCMDVRAGYSEELFCCGLGFWCRRYESSSRDERYRHLCCHGLVPLMGLQCLF